MAFCGECGHQLRPGVHFCEECGTAIPSAEATGEQAPGAESPGTPEAMDAAEAPEAPDAAAAPEVPTVPDASGPPEGPGPEPAAPEAAAAPAAEAPTAASPVVSAPAAPAAAAGAAPVAAAPADRNKRLLAAVVIFLVIAGIVFGAFAFLGGDDDDTKVADQPSGGEIFLEPINASVPDPFTESAVDGEEEPVEVDLPAITRRSTTTTAAGVQAVPTVAGAQVGLYGGTLDTQRCDPEQMIDFLTDDEVKAKAWADVHGIAPGEIPSYIRSLTPVILTRDTRVTNHGYSNGRATPRQAVLQAGTAVLVDRYGVPRVKCGCGNPLAPPVAVAGTPVYTGTRWEGFDPAIVVVVIIDRPVDRFILVDLDGGAPFARTIGVNGVDETLSPAARCKVFPDDPDCDEARPTTTTTTEPDGFRPPDTPPEELFEIGNIGGVQNGPTQPSIVSFDRAVYIRWIVDYHWNNATGATPGTIALRSLADGTVYGPWRTEGLEGQGGVPNAYWQATVNDVFPAGQYEVIDSDPSTWATNAEAGNRGMVRVFGWSVGQSVEPPTTTTTAPPLTTTTTMATGIGDTEAAAVGLLGELLSSCGSVDLLETGSLGAGPTGMWLVAGYLNEGEVRYLVNPSTVDVVPQDQFSAEIAVECGFYQP